MFDDLLYTSCPGTEAELSDDVAPPVARLDDGEPFGREESPPEPPLQAAASPPPARASTSHRSPPPVDAFLRRQQQQQLQQLADAEPPEREQHARGFVLFHATPGWLFSAIVHLLAFLTLSVYVPDPDRGAKYVSLRAVDAGDDTGVESFVETILEAPPAPVEIPAELVPDERLLDSIVLTAPEITSPEIVVPEPDMPAPLPDAETQTSSARPGSEPRFQVGDDARGGLSQRGDRRRQALTRGATAESENAVELALQWLARHQRLDGSWNFQQQLEEHDCPNCRCSNPGSYVDAENGATGLVLLALLGAGHTHLQGEYRDEVAAGLRFLIEHQESNGSLRDPAGRMYSHGLATLALCEALAMTRNASSREGSAAPRWEARSLAPAGSRGNSGAEWRQAEDGWLAAASANSPMLDVALSTSVPVSRSELRRAAQSAIRYIEAAQHSGGGWRYQPRERGDTSVVGWQLMALKSAYLAGLEVNPRTLTQTTKFLDFVSEDRVGSCYGYTHGRKLAYVDQNYAIRATTPIGLLCRMYTGWEHKRPGLGLGVQRLLLHARPGMGLYHYYYATQVMHHYGGPAWEKWNEWMRDYLVQSQSMNGSETGSWYLDGNFDDAGRLYCTALAAMTLEVYYRYSPIYSKSVVLDRMPARR